jgi:hypothetical protein
MSRATCSSALYVGESAARGKKALNGAEKKETCVGLSKSVPLKYT